MAVLKGIAVTLFERTPAGTDAFGAPLWEEHPVQVDNVLAAPASAEDVTAATQLYGKRAVYTLCLPKGDAHSWEDCRVDFFGRSWRVFGPAQEWIEAQVPLDWNRKVMVERCE